MIITQTTEKKFEIEIDDNECKILNEVCGVTGQSPQDVLADFLGTGWITKSKELIEKNGN